MPLNLIKKYSDLLEILHLSQKDGIKSLRGIYDRDIQENENLTFLDKIIRPMKIDGQASFETVFNHLTTKEIEYEEDGKKYKKRIFEINRSVRLHWIRFHLEQNKKEDVLVFSFIDRDKNSRKDVIRTYIYDVTHKYVIILHPQKSTTDYYLITAYYLSEEWGSKDIERKFKKKLPDIY